MLMNSDSRLSVSCPTSELIKWCKDNLVLPNPEYEKKMRMHLWLGNTSPKLTLYEVVGDTLVLPYGVQAMLPKELLDQCLIMEEHKKSLANFEGANIPLYSYQQIAVDKMLDTNVGILQSAAGSGKTQMGLALAVARGRRTLWLCHTLDLVKQSRDRAKQYINENLLGTISEGKVHLGSCITFATVQTMAKLDLVAYKYYWDCIIVDECHRVSGSPTSLTLYSKVLNNLSAKYKYGLSATVHRSDGMITATYALLGKVAYQVPDSDVEEKIMRVGIKSVATGVQMDLSALNTDGTLNYAKLINYLTNNKQRNLLIANNIEVGKSSLILSERLEHLSILKDLLPYEELDKAVMISGKSDKALREQAIEDMRTGKKTYLFATYSLCKEGLDIPRLERLYMASPVKDYAVVTQSIGRIARVCEGKSEPISYDFVDDIGYLVKAYKKRWTTYRKNHCYEVSENEVVNL